MEALFFKDLLAHLRAHDINACYSVSANTDFPVVTLDHMQTLSQMNTHIIEFSMMLLFNTKDQGFMAQFQREIEDQLQNYARQAHIAIQIKKTHKPPHEAGKLRSCTLICAARITHTYIQENVHA